MDFNRFKRLQLLEFLVEANRRLWNSVTQ
jgi:hypothetical protein